MDKVLDLQAITVWYQYEDSGEQIVENYREAYLTSPKHAMIADQGILLIADVKPTDDPSVYELTGPTLELGIVHDPSQSALVIESVTKKLNEMTAYEFVTEIMMKMHHLYDFGDKIVPTPAKNDFSNSTLESGVA